MRFVRRALTIGAVIAAGTVAGAQQNPPPTQPPPVPRPFPGAPTPPPPTSKPTETAAATPGGATATVATAPRTAPTQAELGNAPLYPTAEFLDAFDAGQGQRLLIYGVNMPYADIVTYYRAQLRGAASRELFREPPMYQFDLGRYDEKTMAYAPTLVIKDYTWNGSDGYLQVNGTTQKRYKTIIQIIPASGGGN